MSDSLQLTAKELGYSLTDDENHQIQRFYELLKAENEVQNLTRLIEVGEFVEGHVVDVLELMKSGFLSYPALDIGSGGGVPGLLVALLEEKSTWILTESEKKKAEYLEKSVKSLFLENRVAVFPSRVEEYLKNHSVDTLVARAVGPVERIYSWIRKCSTWNKLVLLKGPAWGEEWEKFLKSRYKKELVIQNEYSYTVGKEKKKRVIIQLTRK